jgi:hypothetical protein
MKKQTITKNGKKYELDFDSMKIIECKKDYIIIGKTKYELIQHDNGKLLSEIIIHEGKEQQEYYRWFK